jgi:hypothetical protein
VRSGRRSAGAARAGARIAAVALAEKGLWIAATGAVTRRFHTPT